MRKIEGVPGYIIFFDNVRVDPLITNFSCDHSNDGSIGRANIEMIYMPELDVTTSGGVKVDAIDNMTNCKIFIKNIFTNKYSLVFDGNIRGKSVTKTPNGNSLSYVAIDHMEALNKTTAPLSVPLTSSVGSTHTMFKLKAQGIDADKITAINSEAKLQFKDKNMQEILDMLKETTLKHNKIFSDPEGVSYWNDSSGRIKVMGDINKKLMASEALDYKLNSNVLSAETMYVMLNDILQKLLFEFYQDRDGYIRIKPPFWNEGIPVNHVIDPSIILSVSENKTWERAYSRVVTTGGVTELESGAANSSEIAYSIFVPLGALAGGTNEIWADAGAGSTYNNINVMLKPTDFERRYGISTFNTVQPLIKKMTENALTGDVYSALRAYSSFMFNMLNSMTETASVNIIGAPWMRPGVNCLLDPLGSNTVYYIAAVSHRGSPNNGVYTSLRLIHGRKASDFFSGNTNIFGSLRFTNRDNVFINSITMGPETYNSMVLGSSSDYNKIVNNAKGFHNADSVGITKADSSTYLRSLYGENRKNETISANSGKLTRVFFTGEADINEIQNTLNTIYAAAPTVVRSRASRIRNTIVEAKKNAYKKYITTVFNKQ